MATVTVERERRDAKSACRVARFTLGGSSARRELGRSGPEPRAQRSTPAMMSSTVRPAKASMSRRLA
jgi:hypothetical protein